VSLEGKILFSRP